MTTKMPRIEMATTSKTKPKTRKPTEAKQTKPAVKARKQAEPTIWNLPTTFLDSLAPNGQPFGDDKPYRANHAIMRW